MTKYFHDAKSRTVWAVNEPSAIAVMQTKTKKRPRPKVDHYSVSQTWEITRADNWIDSKTGQWHHAVGGGAHDRYLATNDTMQTALSWFRMNHGPKGVGAEITREEYERCKAEYEAIALKNKPPP